MPVCVSVRACVHVKPRKGVCESGLIVIIGVIAELQPSQTLARVHCSRDGAGLGGGFVCVCVGGGMQTEL